MTTVEEARPRVQRMLECGYGFERIEEEIEAIEGLDAEARSAIWVWAWMCAIRDAVSPRNGGPHEGVLEQYCPALAG